MNHETLVESLKQIEVLVADCLRAVAGNLPASQTQRPSLSVKRSNAVTLPDQILELRESAFFKESRTARETHQELQSIYPCEADRVVMALIRLNERKQLRRTSKIVGKREVVAYVW
jgi:hypothetical protein